MLTRKIFSCKTDGFEKNADLKNRASKDPGSSNFGEGREHPQEHSTDLDLTRSSITGPSSPSVAGEAGKALKASSRSGEQGMDGGSGGGCFFSDFCL
ncbi:hypothetical protein L1987_80517 [Smallanthus sonchifolius]|uniref:Uncharacterized protein n=1 Tax=Smallanthus sonchifolius TaxID=185202 RepID=A0ACB8YNF5_9ASTR|nr:hypothetical protein L1987_80517 [Smallanthus sonchifolius]